MMLYQHDAFINMMSFINMMFLSKAYGIVALGQIYVKLFLEKIYFFTYLEMLKQSKSFRQHDAFVNMMFVST